MKPLQPMKKCYHDHPALIIPVNGSKRVIEVYGGSCIVPIVKDADIYVGLDTGMQEHENRFPWVTGESFLFDIPNMGVPKDNDAFDDMIFWLGTQAVKEAAKVHVGCIGGHGRTGMVLAAMVRTVGGIEDATAYVREHYCEKAVETDTQIGYLYNQFDIAPVAPRYSTKDLKAMSRPKSLSTIGDSVIDIQDWLKD